MGTFNGDRNLYGFNKAKKCEGRQKEMKMQDEPGVNADVIRDVKVDLLITPRKSHGNVWV